MKDVILVILALMVLVVVIHQVWIRVAMRNWPIIEGKVVKGEVTFDRAAGGRLRYFPSVCVEYDYQGNKKSSSSLFLLMMVTKLGMKRSELLMSYLPREL